MNFIDKILYAGATWKFEEDLDEYPASEGWGLSIFLKHKNEAHSAITAIASGDKFAFDIPISTTSLFINGEYFWQAILSKAGEIEIYDEGTKTIEVILSLKSDTRTENEIILDAIIATITNLATREQLQIEVAGMKLQYREQTELERLRKMYEAKVASEKRKLNGLTSQPRILEKS